MQKEKGRTANGTTQLEQGQHITKYELVATHLLEQGVQGVSALSGLAGLHDLNLRNSIGLLRRNHGVAITDAFLSTSIAVVGPLASSAIGWPTVSKPISWWL